MTKEEAAQRIWDWFVVGGNPPGTSKDGECSYRGEGGSRCAAGCLIPDDLYRPEMEGETFEGILALEPRLQSVFGDAVDFIGAAQYEHDVSSNDEEWGGFPSRLLALCEKHGVTIDRRGK